MHSSRTRDEPAGVDDDRLVVVLGLASLLTALNRGDERPALDFASKMSNFGAATFSLFAGATALTETWMLG